MSEICGTVCITGFEGAIALASGSDPAASVAITVDDPPESVRMNPDVNESDVRLAAAWVVGAEELTRLVLLNENGNEAIGASLPPLSNVIDVSLAKLKPAGGLYIGAGFGGSCVSLSISSSSSSYSAENVFFARRADGACFSAPVRPTRSNEGPVVGAPGANSGSPNGASIET